MALPDTAIVVTSGLQGLAVNRALGERGVPVVVVHTSLVLCMESRSRG